MKAIGIVILIIIVVVKSDDEIDPVIDMLLNGDLHEYTDTNEDINETAPQFVGGIWKCGNCSDLGNAELMHSQTNEVHADMDYVDNVEDQISLAIDAMRCITVASDRAGVVKKVLGSCTGSTITLSIDVSNYTILVYK